MPILIPTKSAEDWQAFLADPGHWRTGRSAKTLAYCWEEARGFPACVKKAFEASGLPHLKAVELLLAMPEHKVALPGGSRASQSDIFALARSSEGLIAMMIEGKVDETFGPLVSEWSVDASDGKRERLQFVLKTLSLAGKDVGAIRYQLLHRAASAVLEARRFHASHALMLVHSFCPQKTWFDDYTRFAALFGLKAAQDTVQKASSIDGLDLCLGWVCGEARFLKS
jgi:hypothetical protein